MLFFDKNKMIFIYSNTSDTNIAENVKREFAYDTQINSIQRQNTYK